MTLPTTTETRNPIAVLHSAAGERCELFLVQGRATEEFPDTIGPNDFSIVEKYTPSIHEITGVAYQDAAAARQYLEDRKATLLADGWLPSEGVTT